MKYLSPLLCLFCVACAASGGVPDDLLQPTDCMVDALQSTGRVESVQLIPLLALSPAHQTNALITYTVHDDTGATRTSRVEVTHADSSSPVYGKFRYVYAYLAGGPDPVLGGVENTWEGQCGVSNQTGNIVE